MRGLLELDRPVRIALVDDHALFRRGLRALLEREHDLTVVLEADDADGALRLLGAEPVDLAVVDLALGESSGLTVLTELRRSQPACAVLVLSMTDDPYRVVQALLAGAAGYALKSQPTVEVLDAVRAVMRGARYLAPRLPRQRIEELFDAGARSPIDRLTGRERAVFRLLVRGFRSADIADQLKVSERTVEFHRSRIFEKLGHLSLVDLVRLAAQHGLLEDP